MVTQSCYVSRAHGNDAASEQWNLEEAIQYNVNCSCAISTWRDLCFLNYKETLTLVKLKFLHKEMVVYLRPFSHTHGHAHGIFNVVKYSPFTTRRALLENLPL